MRKTEETKRKMSEAHKGKKHPHKGAPLSEEHKRKLSIAKTGKNHPNYGKHLSEEIKRKIGIGNKGKHQSEETKRKLSKINKGKNSPMLGKHHTEETKKKLSDKHKGKHKSPFSEEHKRKISEARKGNKNPSWKGGVTPLALMIRGCFKYRQWRSDIFTRDNFTCVFCGKKGRIEADHYPESFSSMFHRNKIKTIEDALICEELWNINNGRTLCVTCHKTTDNYLNHRKILNTQ